MGIVISCCRSTSSEAEYLTPSVETKRRQQQAEAAERLKQESKGIKDPEKLKEKNQRLEALERKKEEAQRNLKTEQPKLQWTVG